MTWRFRAGCGRRGARRAAALLVLAVLALAPAPASAQRDAGLEDVLRNLPDRFPVLSDLVQARSAIEARPDRIDPMLLALSDQVEARGVGALSAQADAYRMSVSDDLVAVTLIADDAFAADDLEWRVEDEGGIVTARFENVVLAEVPVDRIEGFGEEEALHYMTAQARYALSPPDDAGFEPFGVTGDGVEAINVRRLHDAGITGEGVKVGILDFGFQGYAELVRRGELPRAVAQRAFNQAGRLENGEVHGTACAEIIHDVAPGAELFLAAIDGQTDQIVNAARWLAEEQGVDIISFSGGGHFGPHNGTAILDRLVDAVVAETGVLWVNAAGNEGAKHWGGPARDADGDGWIEFGRRWPALAVRPARGAGGQIAVRISWDDWGDPRRPTPTQDVDAFLFEFDPRTRQMRPVARSISPQNGRGYPMEQLVYQGRPGREYVVALRATRVTRPVQMHVFNLAPGAMVPAAPSGSIGIPATARSALAVGAVDVTSGRLEAYSSQGPTDDGRVKPEVSAPDKTRSLAYDGRFPGTSAACPHVSGFAALLKELDPAADRVELTRMVLRNVRPMGRGTPNNQYGHGHIDASKIVVDDDDIDPYDVEVVELPDVLGGRTSVRTLNALWRMAARPNGRPAALGVRVRVDRRSGQGGALPVYRIGDEMKVGFATDERCRYALIQRDAGGRYRLFSPDEAPTVAPGDPRLLPEGRGETWTIAEPLGDEGFLLVCARRQVDLDDWVRRQGSGDVGVAAAEYRVAR